MSSTANFIVSGVLSDGTPIVFGAVPSDGTSHTAIHHVSSASQFQAESWDGEHADHEHHEHEEPRRFSIYLEESGAEKSGLNQDDDDILDEEPIASSGQFERTRSASLAAALLELDPRGVPLVQFFKLATTEPLLEVDEGEDEVAPSEAELVLSQLLFTLRSLKMSGGDAKHSEAVQRLRELEEELRAAGAVTPADPAVSEAVARALAVAGAGRDVQIRVNQSKHTTTTKTVYETETSAMAHMDVDQIRKLQQDIIVDISAGAEQHSGQDSGTTQKKETAEEGFTNEDGSVVVSKKMTRVVTTTRTTLPGEGEEPSAPDSPVESLGSVKDRIAKFEQFKTLPIDPSVSGPPPSVHALPAEEEEEEQAPIPAARDLRRESSDVLKETTTTTTTTVTREFHEEPENIQESHEIHQESPASQGFHAESSQQQPESGDESNGEGFGSKVLGFAKKAGMVAGGVVAAPVALAAVGAKAAYDALKKDSDDEGEGQQQEESFSPAPSSHAESEHRQVSESSALSQKADEEHPHVVETTTTTTVTREFEEPTSAGRDSGRSGHSEQSIPEVQFTESDTEIERHEDEHHEDSFLEPTVGIVITPHTPIPPEHPDDVEEVEDEQPQEPLELAEPEHVAHAEIKDTREYSDEELSHELSPSEEHVSTAEIKDIKSYSPTSSDDERKGKVSPPLPQVRHAISPSVASEVSSHDDELAAHFVAESFEKHDEGRVETIEQTPIYRGHHSPVQTSPIVSEHPIAQEYAESVTSHDEGDNISLKSGHEPEIARHSVGSLQEEEEEKSGLGDYAKKAGMIVGGVIAAPIALAAVGAKAAYDALKKDSDEEEEKPDGHEEQEVLTTQTTIMESPIEHEDIPPPHLEDVTPKVSHHEQQQDVVIDLQTESPSGSPIPSERSARSVQQAESPFGERHSPVPSEPMSEKDAHHVTETTTTTTVTREFYDEPQDYPEESHSPVPSSHVESQRPSVGYPVASEEDYPAGVVETTTTTTYVTRQEEPETDERRSPSPDEHMVETTTTTTITREYEEEDQDSESPDSVREVPHVTETTTTTTVTKEYEPEEEFDSERLSEPSKSPEPAESEKSIPHVVETTTTTTVTRETFDVEEPEHREESPVYTEQHDDHSPSGSPIPSERSARSVQQAESPFGERHSPVPSEPISEKDHVTETTTTTTVTREYYEPEEHHERESPIPSEKSVDAHFVKETTTTAAITRDFYDEPEQKQEASAIVPSTTYEFKDDEYPRPESPAEVYPVKSAEHPDVTEITTTTTVTREFYDDDYERPESQPSQKSSERYDFHQESPATQGTHDESASSQQPESGDESDGEGFGSKVLGFAKKAGMVAGGVVAAPVALAAVGAKAAYDALKKDSDDEGEEKHHEHQEESFSPAPSSRAESGRIPESPAVSEKELLHAAQPEIEADEPSDLTKDSPLPSEEHHIVTETTTIVTREVFDEPQEHPEESYVESERPLAESPVEKEQPHHVETTTTTTITREYEEDPEHFEENIEEPEQRGSPLPAESHEHLVKETTTTMTVTREFFDEPEHTQEHPEESYSPALFSHVESERHLAESPEHPHHVVETTTTTTVTREFHDDEHETPFDIERDVPFSEVEHHDLDSEEQEHPHVTETTTTSTITREYDEDASLEDLHRAVSPTTSVDGSEPHVTETATTTTLTREYDVPEEGFDSERLSEPSKSPEPAEREKLIPQVVETTTTTTVTREFYDEEEPEHREASPVYTEQHDEHSPSGSPIPSERSARSVQQTESPFGERHSPVPSEPMSEKDHVTETTTTTTVTRELYDEPEHPSDLAGESPVPSEKEHEHHVVTETTTTTTVTREYDAEPEHAHDHPEESYSPAPSSHVESEHRPVPESPIVSEKQFTTETSLTQDSPAAQYFHEQPEHQTETRIPTEQSTLLSQQHQQPESGDESDGEGFGSKVLGFAKKAGMVAGGVVVAPVALAAVGAKAAYDALKKDSDDEGERQQQDESFSPAPSSHADSEHRQVPESPVMSQKTDEEHQHAESPMRSEGYQQLDEPEERFQESPVSSEKHHVTETTTTTTVTREYFDEPESPVPSQEGHESEVESHKSIPHVVETTTTTTVKRDYEEEPTSESPIPSEKETTTSIREVFETAEGDEPEHHYIETTTTTVQKEMFEELEEAEDDGEPKPEMPHVVETTTTTKTTREFEDDEEGSESESAAPHVTETTTTTTVVREFYGDQPEELLEEEPVAAEVEGEDVSPDSASTTSVSREVREDEPHVVETTTTTTVTREYHDEPEESKDVDVKETTTTVTRDHYEEEPKSPAAEDDRESPVQHVTETTTTTTISRDIHEEDDPRVEHLEHREDSPLGQEHENLQRSESPVHVEPHVTETTTTTTVTREYDQPEEGFDSERLSEPSKSPEPAESEKSIPHVVETTTTTTVTREFYDNEEPEDREASPVLAEPNFEQRESPVSPRGSPIPSEHEHLVKETTTTTTVTRDFYDEPEHPSDLAGESPVPSETEHEHHVVTETTTTTTVTREYDEEPKHAHDQQEESFSPAPSSHVESEHRPVPESPMFSEKQFTTETSLTQDSPAAQYFHEQPEHQTESLIPTEQSTLLSQQHQQPESGDESDGEGFGSKVLGFAKKAGMVAGGVVAAPVALAAVGAKAAYDALKKDSDGDEDEDEQKALLGDVREQRPAESPSRSEGYERFQESPEPSAAAHPHGFQTESPVQPAQEEDQESLKSPTESEQSFRHVVGTTTTTTTTHEQFQDDSAPASPAHSHKEELKQFQDEQSSGESSEKEAEKEAEIMKPELERQGSYSPGYSPKSPSGSLADLKVESRLVVESAEEHDEVKVASPVSSEEGSTKFMETTTKTTVTREYEEPESQDYQSGSPVPSEQESNRVIETTTTTTVTREQYEPEEELSHVVESQQYSPSESPVPSEKSSGHVVETTTTTTVTQERYEPEDEQDHAGSHSPDPSEKSVGHVVETTTTTTVTKEYEHPEEKKIGAAESSSSFEPETSHITREQESPVQQQFEDYQHQYSEEPAIAPYKQPTEYGRVDSHDAPASPAPSAESPAPHAQQGFESERLPEPSRYSEDDDDEQQPQRIPIVHESTRAAQYLYEEPEQHTDSPPTEQAPLLSQQPDYQTESPIPTEHSTLLSQQHQQPESGDESDGEGFGSKVLGFAKTAGMVAGGVVAAPVALAAVGAKAAYDALKKDSDGEDEEEQKALLEDVREQRSAESPLRSEGYERFNEPEQRFQESPEPSAAPEFQPESPIKTQLTEPASDDESPASDVEPEHLSRKVSESEQSHHYTETIRKTTVTREYLDDDESLPQDPHSESQDPVLKSPSEQVVETTTTVIRHYHDEPQPEAESEEKTLPEEVTVLREVYEAPAGDEPEHHYIETKTTTTITKEVHEPEDSDVPSSPIESEKNLPSQFEEPHSGDTTITTVTRELEPEGVRPPSGSEADDESHAPRYLETTTTTTVTREYEVSEDEEDAGHPSVDQHSEDSPTPSEESVTRVEKTTTTTVTETRYEPDEDHDNDYTKTTTTTTTVTREQLEDEPEHSEYSQDYQSGSPVPSEQESSRVIEKTTTTTVTREHYDPEEEPSHIVESQQYSPSGSPVPSEKSIGHVAETTTTTTVTEERYEPEDEQDHVGTHSPVPTEEDVHRYVKTTTTTTTVTREHFEPEDEPSHVVESEEYPAGSPVPSEKSIAHEPEQHHFTEAQMAQDSPAAQYFHEQPEHHTDSPPTEQAPLLSQRQESGDESDGEGFGSKVLGFAKKAGMVAGGVVAAPVALAAVGAKAAYDALKKDSDGEEYEEEQKALLGAVDSETQEPGATFYEPEEEDKVPEASPKEQEPKIVFPVDSPADKLAQEKQAFESAVQAEGPYVIESDDYEPSVHQEQRISSPVHSDSGEVHQQDPEEEEETPRVAQHQESENAEADAPYVIDSEEYEFNNREEQRISSPAHSDEEEAEHEGYGAEQENNDEEDPTIVESGEYTGSGQGSPRPFEESTTTTVISVHHEPTAIPEPEVYEEELEQDRSIIESGEYSTGSPVPSISVSNVEHVQHSEHHEYTPQSPTTVASEHLEAEKDPSVVESEEYIRSSPIGHERPESPSGSPIQHQVEDDSHVIESQEYTGSPVPSEDSVQHVVEKVTTTTTTEEHFEPDDSSEDVQEYVKTTTTTTTVTQEHFEPEEEEKHVVESQDYQSGSPVPSEPESARVIETTTTTTVTREHIEPEDETSHIVESQQYSPSGSPVPSERSTGQVIETKTTTTVTREHVEPDEELERSAPGSPTPSDKSVDRVLETTTTTTVTREHVEHEDDFGPLHTGQGLSRASPEEEEDLFGFVKTTTTTTTVTREHFEPEDEIVESQKYSPSGSPVPSEKSVGHVVDSSATTIQTHERFEPEDERRTTSVPSEGEVPESIKTTTDMTSESHVEPEQQHQDSGDESDGEGFGSKVLGFAKKAGMVAGGVVAAPVALAAVGAKAAYDALKKDSDEEGEDQEDSYRSVQRPAPTIEAHQEKDGSDSDGSFVDHGEDSQHLPPQSTEAAFKLSTEDVAEQTAEKLVSEVFSPLDRTLKESEQYRASIESLNRRSPVESKKSVEDLASEALENVTKISFGHADEAEDKHDDDHDGEWKVYDRHGEVLEEFSTQLTDDVIQEAEGDATTQIMTMTQAEYSPRRSKFLKQESCQEISNEPEVDYYSDLQEKLNILAGEKNNLQALIEEEPSSSASDQLDVIHESDQEAHLEQEHQQEAAAQKEQEEKEEAAEYTATILVDEVLQQVVHEILEEEDDQKTMTSDAYLTATEKDDQEYDTCVTSQDDTYESAQGWTSQDSEYTTATSQAPSRLSDSDGEHTARDLERQETSTPQAMMSPVDSDRQFTAQQDYELPVIKAFDTDDFLQTTARSTPDVALQVTIEEEDESDDKLPISPSGILLPPKHDPGRPISPVPPRKSDATMQKEGDHFVFVREEDTIAEPTPPPQQFHPESDEVRRTPDDTLSTIEVTVPQSEEETEMRRQETERIHSLAMEASSDLGNSESSRYSRQLSDLSSSAESHADTVIRVESERSGSSDSLEVVSVISAGKDARTSEKSLTPEEKSPIEEKAEDVKEEQDAEDLGFEIYDADTEEQQQQTAEELETVEEEPEDSDSLNEGGNHSSGHSSVGVPADTLAMIGKYRHQSSDNLSLTSLQEFERLEREVGARGDGSLTRSEIELLVAGRLNKSGEGSVSSLAEFERLEKEMTENQSPPEDVMMLSDIREESEAEDMSTRGDDEEDIGGSDTEMRSRPVQEEDLRAVTPLAPSPTDSLEHAIDPLQMQYLETSTDSLEPTFQEIEVEQRPDSVEDTSLTEYEMVPRVMEASTTDSLDGTATIEKDSVLEGASQGIESTQSTHGLLSGDTMGTVVTDDDRDSLDGEVSSMLQSYPTTLTTFQTTVVGPDGSLQTISRRVETRVTDPLVSHVTFTGTESQERLDQLPDDEQFETVDTEGNVTRTTFHREHDQQHPQF